MGSAGLLKILKNRSNYNKRRKNKAGLIIKMEVKCCSWKICTHRRLRKLNLAFPLSYVCSAKCSILLLDPPGPEKTTLCVKTDLLSPLKWGKPEHGCKWSLRADVSLTMALAPRCHSFLCWRLLWPRRWWGAPHRWPDKICEVIEKHSTDTWEEQQLKSIHKPWQHVQNMYRYLIFQIQS